MVNLVACLVSHALIRKLGTRLLASAAGFSYGIGLAACGALLGGAGHGTLLLLDLAFFPSRLWPLVWVAIGMLGVQSKPKPIECVALIGILFLQYGFIALKLFTPEYRLLEDIIDVARHIPLIAGFALFYVLLGQIYLWQKISSGLKGMCQQFCAKATIPLNGRRIPASSERSSADLQPAPESSPHVPSSPSATPSNLSDSLSTDA